MSDNITKSTSHNLHKPTSHPLHHPHITNSHTLNHLHIPASHRLHQLHKPTSHTLHHLHTRQLSLDPFQRLSTFKQSYYSCKSFVRRLTLERQLEGHQGCVNCINFSFSGELLASGSDDLHLILWDWARGRVVGKYDTGHVANVFQAKFMPYTEDKVMVTAARDGQIRLMVLSSTGEVIHSKRVGHHNDSAHKLSVQPDSPHLFLSCGEDGSVLEVDLREECRTRVLVCKNGKNRRIPLYSIFIDPSDYHYFAVSGRDQFARIYDRRFLRETIEGVEPVKKFCPHILEEPETEYRRANITCLVYSHDGKELLCSYNDDDIYLFDTSHSTGADYIKKYSGHRNSATVKGVNFFGLQSEYVVSGSDCGHVFLWDKNTQEIVQCLEGDQEGVVNCLEPHPHIPVLATSGLDHEVKLFTPTAAQPTSLNGVDELVQENTSSREEAQNSPSDGMELFMEFLIRQYRRRMQQEIGIPNEFSDSSDDDREESEGEGDNVSGDEGTESESDDERKRCVHQ